MDNKKIIEECRELLTHAREEYDKETLATLHTLALDILRAILAEANDDCDYETLAPLHPLALDILQATTTQNHHFECTVEWWEGCHCHGNSRSETFDAETIESMAKQLAECEHTVTWRGDNQIDKVFRRVFLSTKEQDELSARFKVWSEYYTTLRAIQKSIENAEVKLSFATGRLKTEQDTLGILWGELNSEAIATRQKIIEGLIEEKVRCEKTLTELKQSLALHRNKTP
jgi:hypothetical protein